MTHEEKEVKIEDDGWRDTPPQLMKTVKRHLTTNILSPW